MISAGTHGNSAVLRALWADPDQRAARTLKFKVASRPRGFTEQDDALLTSLRANGLSYKEIARLTDRTPKALRNRVCKIGKSA